MTLLLLVVLCFSIAGCTVLNSIEYARVLKNDPNIPEINWRNLFNVSFWLAILICRPFLFRFILEAVLFGMGAWVIWGISFVLVAIIYIVASFIVVNTASRLICIFSKK